MPAPLATVLRTAAVGLAAGPPATADAAPVVFAASAAVGDVSFKIPTGEIPGAGVAVDPKAPVPFRAADAGGVAVMPGTVSRVVRLTTFVMVAFIVVGGGGSVVGFDFVVVLAGVVFLGGVKVVCVQRVSLLLEG